MTSSFHVLDHHLLNAEVDARESDSTVRIHSLTDLDEHGGMVLQTIPVPGRILQLLWTGSDVSSQFLVITKESIRMFGRETTSGLHWIELKYLQLARPLACIVASFNSPLLYIASNIDALLINLENELHHSFLAEQLPLSCCRNCKISPSTDYLAWCEPFIAEYSQQQFKVLDLSPIKASGKVKQPLSFQSAAVKVDTAEPIAEVRWRHQFDPTGPELILISFKSGRVLVCEVSKVREVEDDSIVAIALNAAISAGVVSAEEKKDIQAQTAIVTIRPVITVLKDISCDFVLSAVGMASIALESVAWVRGHGTPPEIPPPDYEQAAEKTQNGKRNGNAKQQGQSAQSQKKGSARIAPPAAAAVKAIAKSDGPATWIALIISSPGQPSQLLLLSLVWDVSLKGAAVKQRMLAALETRSSSGGAGKKLNIQHIVGFFDHNMSYPNLLEVYTKCELDASNKVKCVFSQTALRCEINNRQEYTMTAVGLVSYLVTASTIAQDCTGNTSCDTLVSVKDDWAVALRMPFRQPSALSKIVASFVIPDQAITVKPIVLRSICMALPCDLHHDFWILLLGIPKADGNAEHSLACYRIASQPLMAMLQHVGQDLTHGEQTSVANTDEHFDEQYVVEIIPDPQYGLGLRLDEVRAAANPQQLQILVTSFKRHPVTNEILGAELGGFIHLGDELVGINSFRFAGQPLASVIPTIRTILNSTAAEQTVQLVLRKISESLSKQSSSSDLSNVDQPTAPSAPNQAKFSFSLVHDTLSCTSLDVSEAGRIVAADLFKCTDIRLLRAGHVLVAKLLIVDKIPVLTCQWLQLNYAAHEESGAISFITTPELTGSGSLELGEYAAALESMQTASVSFRACSARSFDEFKTFYIIADIKLETLTTCVDIPVLVACNNDDAHTSIAMTIVDSEHAIIFGDENAQNMSPQISILPAVRILQLHAQLRTAMMRYDDQLENPQTSGDEDVPAIRGREEVKQGFQPILLMASLSASFVHSIIARADAAPNMFYNILHTLLTMNPSYSIESTLITVDDTQSVVQHFQEEHSLSRTLRYLMDKLRGYVGAYGMRYTLHLAYDIDGKDVQKVDPIEDIPLGDSIAPPTAFSLSFILLSALQLLLHPFLQESTANASIAQCIEQTILSCPNSLSDAQVLSNLLTNMCSLLNIDNFAELALIELAVQNGWLIVLGEVRSALLDTCPRLFTSKEMLLHPDAESDAVDAAGEFSMDSNKGASSKKEQLHSKHHMLSALQTANLLFSSAQTRVLGMLLQPSSSSAEEPSKPNILSELLLQWGANSQDSPLPSAPVDIFKVAVDLKLSFWMHDIEPLFDIIYQFCMQSFKVYKSSMQIFLPMVVIGKMDRLLQLAKADSSSSGKQLLSLLYMVDDTYSLHNTKPDKFQVLQTKLRKNAFALIRKHRHKEAAAVFLLCPSKSMIKSAQSVLVKQYDQPFLAHLILRLLEHRFLHVSTAEGSAFGTSMDSFDALDQMDDAKEYVLEHAGKAAGPFSQEVLRCDILPMLLKAAKVTSLEAKNYHNIGCHGICGLDAAIMAIVCALWLQDARQLQAVFEDINNTLKAQIVTNHQRSYSNMTLTDLPLELVSLMAGILRDELPLLDVVQLFKYLQYAETNTKYLHEHMTLQHVMPFLVECGAFVGTKSMRGMMDLLDLYYTSNHMDQEKLRLLDAMDKFTESEVDGLLKGNAFHQFTQSITAVASSRTIRHQFARTSPPVVPEAKAVVEDGAPKMSFNFAKLSKPAPPAPAPAPALSMQSPGRTTRSALDDFDHSLATPSMSREISAASSPLVFDLSPAARSTTMSPATAPTDAGAQPLSALDLLDSFIRPARATSKVNAFPSIAADPYASAAGSALDVFDNFSRPSRSGAGRSRQGSAPSSEAKAALVADDDSKPPAADPADPYANAAGSALDMMDNYSRPARATKPASSPSPVPSSSAATAAVDPYANTGGSALDMFDNYSRPARAGNSNGKGRTSPVPAPTPAAADPYAAVSGSALDMFDNHSRPSKSSGSRAAGQPTAAVPVNAPFADSTVKSGQALSADEPAPIVKDNADTEQPVAVDPYANVAGSALDMMDNFSRPTRKCGPRSRQGSAQPPETKTALAAEGDHTVSKPSSLVPAVADPYANAANSALEMMDNYSRPARAAKAVSPPPALSSSSAAAVVDPYANTGGSALDMFDNYSRPARSSSNGKASPTVPASEAPAHSAEQSAPVVHIPVVASSVPLPTSNPQEAVQTEPTPMPSDKAEGGEKQPQAPTLMPTPAPLPPIAVPQHAAPPVEHPPVPAAPMTPAHDSSPPAGRLLVPFRSPSSPAVSTPRTMKKAASMMHSKTPASSHGYNTPPPAAQSPKTTFSKAKILGFFHLDDSSSHAAAGRTLEQKIRDFYAKHNPSKLSEVPAILAKYQGREQELVAKLQKQYNDKVV